MLRENSEAPSDFPFGQPLDCGGLFLVVVFAQPLASPEFPLVCEFEITVDVDEVEPVDDTDDEELVRWMVLRPNMLVPRKSSAFIELVVWPTLAHPDRLRFEKLGGAATAVMGKMSPITQKASRLGVRDTIARVRCASHGARMRGSIEGMSVGRNTIEKVVNPRFRDG